MLKVRIYLAIGFAISLASQLAANAADVGKPADPHHRRYVHHRIRAVRGSVATTAVAPGVPAAAKARRLLARSQRQRRVEPQSRRTAT